MLQFVPPLRLSCNPFSLQLGRQLLLLGGLLMCVGLCLQPRGANAQRRFEKRLQETFNEARGHFNNRSYLVASDLFDKLANLQEHKLTTTSLYMAGLAYYYGKENEQALARFQHLVKYYPQSRYLGDAQYHKALIMLEDLDRREGGLYLLLNLSDTTQNRSLKTACKQALDHFLYQQATPYFLNNYIQICRPEFRTQVRDALCYHWYQRKEYEKLTDYLLNLYELEGELPGRLSVYEALIRKVLQDQQPDSLRVAVVLPMQNTQEQQGRQLPGLEFVSGFRFALQDIKNPKSPTEIRFFDSGPNERNLQNLLLNELALYKPHLVIGGLATEKAEQLAEWANKQQAVLWVPFSQAPSLVQNREHVFLANASLERQAEVVAQYSLDLEQVQTYYVLSDGSRTANAMCTAFEKYLKDNNRFPVKEYIPSNKGAAVAKVKKLARRIRTAGPVTVYFPTKQEDLVGVLLESMNLDAENQVTLIGIPDWVNFQYIDLDLLFKSQTLYFESFYLGNDTTAYKAFEKDYASQYHRSPGIFAAQGYDMGRLLVQQFPVWEEKKSAAALLQEAEPFKGLNQNYYYNQAHSNQAKQLMQFIAGTVTKLRLW